MTEIPVPREGLPGAWDAYVGPGASPWEDAGTLGLGIVGAVAAPILVARERPGSGPVELATAAVIGAELAAGAWSGETPSGKRWFHHRGSSRVRRIAFAAMHISPFVAETASRRFRFRSAAVSYSSLVLAATTLELVPTRRRRSAAMALYTAWLAGNSIFAPAPAGYAWLHAVLGYKVLVSHGTPASPLSRLRRKGR